LNSPLNTPHGSVNAFVVSEPVQINTSAPRIGLYAWSTTLPVTANISPEIIAPFYTLRSMINSHSSASDVWMLENNIKNENIPTIPTFLYT